MDLKASLLLHCTVVVKRMSVLSAYMANVFQAKMTSLSKLIPFFSVPKAALTTIFGAFSPILFFEIPKVAKEKPSQRPLTESSPYFLLILQGFCLVLFFYIYQLQKAMTYVLCI